MSEIPNAIIIKSSTKRYEIPIEASIAKSLQMCDPFNLHIVGIRYTPKVASESAKKVEG